MFTDISQEHTDIIDVSRVFADTLYKNGSGIVEHDLALRIYRSEGGMTLTAEEASIIRALTKRCCTPLFIDSIEANFVDGE